MARVLASMLSLAIAAGAVALGLWTKNGMPVPDFPLPYPLARFPIKDISAEDMPNVHDVMSLEGVAVRPLLQSAHKLTGIQSSETVAINPVTGDMTLLDKFGYLYIAKPAVDQAADAAYILPQEPTAYLGPGRPLGFMYNRQGHLIFCDSLKGLMSYDLTSRQLRVLANAVSNSSALDPGLPITYVNDLDIAEDGGIYFTASQDIPVLLHPEGYYDTYKSYLSGVVSGTKSGRLLRYDPATHTTTVLLKGLWYANGVAVSRDQSSLAVVETNRRQIHRYWLKGPKAGTSEVLISRLPGIPDGIKSSPDGGFWVGLCVPVAKILKLFQWKAVRVALAYLPEWARPRIENFLRIFRWGGLLRLDASGRAIALLTDPDGAHVAFVSSAHEHGGRVFLGNVKQDYVSWLELSDLHAALPEVFPVGTGPPPQEDTHN